MNFKWVEYLNLARELVGQPRRSSSLEAKYRTSISRAYYAVFHCAKDYLDSRSLLPGLKKDQHKAVITSFLYSSDKNWIDVGMSMDRIKEARIRADYKASFERIDKKAIDILTESEAVIHKIRSIL